MGRERQLRYNASGMIHWRSRKSLKFGYVRTQQMLILHKCPRCTTLIHAYSTASGYCDRCSEAFMRRSELESGVGDEFAAILNSNKEVNYRDG